MITVLDWEEEDRVLDIIFPPINLPQRRILNESQDENTDQRTVYESLARAIETNNESYYDLEPINDVQYAASSQAIGGSELVNQGREKLNTTTMTTNDLFDDEIYKDAIPKNASDQETIPKFIDDQVINPVTHQHQSEMEETSRTEEPVSTFDAGRQMEMEDNDGPVKCKFVTSSDNSAMIAYLLSNFFQKQTYVTKPQELFRRTFGVPTLIMKIDAKALDNDGDEGAAMGHDNPVWVSQEDEDCINCYLDTHGFRLLCRDDNTFYFSVGNRDWASANVEIDRMQSELRVLCFGRFYGRVIGGKRIEKPEDLIISFRLDGFAHNTWRFCFVLVEHRKVVVVRSGRPITSVRMEYAYMCLCYMLFVWCHLMKYMYAQE